MQLWKFHTIFRLFPTLTYVRRGNLSDFHSFMVHSRPSRLLPVCVCTVFGRDSWVCPTVYVGLSPKMVRFSSSKDRNVQILGPDMLSFTADFLVHYFSTHKMIHSVENPILSHRKAQGRGIFLIFHVELINQSINQSINQPIRRGLEWPK